MHQIDRLSYLSNFEEMVVEHGVGIQHVFADEETPNFSYTVGLFEVDHPEFIVFGMPERLAQIILNNVAFAVLNDGMRFGNNDRVHELFLDAPAHLISAHDPEGDFFGTAYAIRNRRYPDRWDSDIDGLQLIYQDKVGRWPWDHGSDYVFWPMLGDTPVIAAARNLTMSHGDEG